VFVVKEDHTVDLRLVKLGPVIDDASQVLLEGVKPGEHVVTLGQMRLRPGMPVQITAFDGKSMTPQHS
jgi:multidrug efflux system membrane fusion protein